MKNLAVIGAQWGDEGKGKIVDLLCETFDVVARYHGGHNAGHTVKFGEKHFSLRLIPSGILHPDKLCVLGNGMVIAPEALLDEIEQLRGLGVTIDTNLKISDSAHVILPYHRALDLAREEAAGEAKIGTTGRGIGPAYETKVSRYGIRVADLRDRETLRQKIDFACNEKNPVLATVYGKETFDPKKLFDDYARFGEILSPRMVNGIDEIALTKLDVLDEFEQIKVCIGYNVHGTPSKTFPAFAVEHRDYKPEYRTFKGWNRSTAAVTSYDALPQEAKDYIRFIEE